MKLPSLLALYCSLCFGVEPYASNVVISTAKEKLGCVTNWTAVILEELKVFQSLSQENIRAAIHVAVPDVDQLVIQGPLRFHHGHVSVMRSSKSSSTSTDVQISMGSSWVWDYIHLFASRDAAVLDMNSVVNLVFNAAAVAERRRILSDTTLVGKISNRDVYMSKEGKPESFCYALEFFWQCIQSFDREAYGPLGIDESRNVEVDGVHVHEENDLENDSRLWVCVLLFAVTTGLVMFLPNWLSVIIVAAPFLVFGRSLQHGRVEYLNWDDNVNYLHNDLLRPPWDDIVVRAFKRDHVIGVYEPLSVLFKASLIYLLGNSPYVVRVASVVMHCLNAFLASRLCSSHGVCHVSCTLASLLVAVHPLTVEVVCWASCLPYTLATFFALLAVSCQRHAWYCERNRKSGLKLGVCIGWRLSASLCCILAGLSKSAALGLFAHLLLSEVRWTMTISMEGSRHQGNRSEKEVNKGYRSEKDVRDEKRNSGDQCHVGDIGETESRVKISQRRCTLWWPLSLMATLFHAFNVASAVVCVLAARRASILSKERSDGWSWSITFLKAACAICSHVLHTLCPSALRVLYDAEVECVSFQNFWACTGGALVVALTLRSAIVLVHSFLIWPVGERQQNVIEWTYASSLALFAPTLGFVSSHGQGSLVHDRYAYIPSMLLMPSILGQSILFLTGPQQLSKNWRFVCVGAGVAFLSAASSYRTMAYAEAWGTSESLFQWTIRMSPVSATAWNYLGMALVERHAYMEAENHLRIGLLLENRKKDNHVHFEGSYFLGVALKRQGRFAETELAFADAHRLRPYDSNTVQHLGQTYWGMGRHNEAVTQLGHAHRIHPSSPAVLENFGVALSELSRHAESRESLLLGLTLSPSDPSILETMGRLELRLGHEAEAAQRFRQALELDPGRSSAQDALKQSMERPSSGIEGYLRKGDDLAQLGRFQEAEVLFRFAVETDPTSGIAHAQLGYLESQVLQRSNGDFHLRRGLALVPTYARVAQDLGFAMHQRQRDDEAIYLYRYAIDLDPSSEYSWYSLADVLARRGQSSSKDLIHLYGMAVQLQPLMPEAQADLGVTLAKQSRYAESTVRLEAASLLRPTDARYRQNLGMILARQQLWKEAVQQYRIALALDPLNQLLPKLMAEAAQQS